MRIVLVNKFWYQRGGAERVSLLTKELLEKAGHEVEVFGMNHPQNLFTNKYFTDFVDYDDINIFQKIKFGSRAIFNLQAKKNLAALIKDYKPDVVHFHNIYHQLSCSVIEAAKEAGVRTVMTLHDYKLISPNYNLYHHGKIDESCVGGQYYRCVLNNCMENFGESLLSTVESYFVDGKGYKATIDKYLSPSEFLKSKFVAAGFDENKIEKISNPIAKSDFADNITSKDYVAYVGRLSSEKGISTLLRAAEKLPEIKFKIVGEGSDYANLEEFVVTHNLNNVDFVGHKNRTELSQIIDEARLLVSPSVWYENAPMSVMEAMARCKVVIASDIGGLSELLPSDLLVKAGDASALEAKIKEWFFAPTQRLHVMGKQLQSQIKIDNSPELYLKRLLEIYQK